MPAGPVKLFPIVWYEEADYPALRALMVDGHVLPDTWATWHEKANDLISDGIKRGQVTLKVHLKPDAFRAFCAARGLKIDAQARLAYVNEMAVKLYREQGGAG